ncbi:MAG: D-2-hydroxyglutarate dehydrogenase YdiJ, partial [Enterobacteriaceae bacterium]
INNDACGQGSMVYGKTSDHVRQLRVVTVAGEQLDVEAMPVAAAETLARQEDAQGQIYRSVLQRCREKRQKILDAFPPLNRFLTGYDLRHVFSDDMQTFDLTRILCGSEGTLAFITEATVNITPLPKERCLVNIKYDSFDSALRNAPLMVQAQAISVETVDSRVLDLARQDIVWHSIRELITDVPGQEMQGINIVEFAADDPELITASVTRLTQQLEQLITSRQAGVIGYQVCRDPAGIEQIYAMRKKAVGLLGNSPGRARPIPFVEDCCVPPENLADFIMEFRALLDSYQVSYGMFGHVDVGVLHVRPALDMCDPPQEQVLQQISDGVVALTQKYGGLLWGEHGKGFRSQYVPDYFGAELYGELRQIKRAFDPHNRLNPGKICTPTGIESPLLTIDARKRGTFDRQIPLAVRDAFTKALECNGNGLCFNYEPHSPMCPSMKVSNHRIHSPKGRATLLREWLRLLEARGINPLQLEQQLSQQKFSWQALLRQIKARWSPENKGFDFSHEVMTAMSGCLACKACATQCPVKVDVPQFRARFLQLYHSRYPRPVRDYLVANIERITPLLSRAPAVSNFILRQPLVRKVTEKSLKMVNLPQLSQPTLRKALAGSAAVTTTLRHLQNMTPEQRQRHVLIVQDPFTSCYDAGVVADFVRLLEKLGYSGVLLPLYTNGKAQHIKGFLPQFAATARHTAEYLTQVARLQIPMVGVDPALVLCYRDEYRDILGEERGEFSVLLVHEWLRQQLPTLARGVTQPEPWYLLEHCTESTKLPGSARQWQTIFAHFGAQLSNINVGCCGMAGVYGHEAEHSETSAQIYQLSWQKRLHTLPAQRCLATGFSCRSQVKRLEGHHLRHPLQALLEIIT